MCMIDAADGLGNRCQREARRRARKAHKCGECSRVIAPGETYVDASGIDCDGNAWTHKVCAHCDVVTVWLAENCGGWLMQGVLDDIREHVEEYRRMDLARLVVGMQRDWKRFHGGLMPVPKLPRPIELGDAHG